MPPIAAAARNVPTWTIAIDGVALGDDGSGLLPRGLRCELGMDGVGGCTLDMIVPAGARLPAPGAALKVELGFDGAHEPAFSGEIDGVRATIDGVTIAAGDALARLAHSFGSGVFAERSAGAIARDLLELAAVIPGTLDDGPTLAQYVVYPGPSLLHHLQALAASIGAALFADAAGKVHLLAPGTAGKRHSFSLGGDVLAIDLAHAPPTLGSVEVWGEGAGGTEGADRSHWLSTSLSGVRATAGVHAAAVYASPSAARVLLVRDGAARTGDAARAMADGRAAALARKFRGSLEVAGAPGVAPNDVVGLTDFSLPHLEDLLAGAELRVRRVRHRLDLARGFTTRMEF